MDQQVVAKGSWGATAIKDMRQMPMPFTKGSSAQFIEFFFAHMPEKVINAPFQDILFWYEDRGWRLAKQEDTDG